MSGSRRVVMRTAAVGKSPPGRVLGAAIASVFVKGREPWVVVQNSELKLDCAEAAPSDCHTYRVTIGSTHQFPVQIASYRSAIFPGYTLDLRHMPLPEGGCIVSIAKHDKCASNLLRVGANEPTVERILSAAELLYPVWDRDLVASEYAKVQTSLAHVYGLTDRRLQELREANDKFLDSSDYQADTTRAYMNELMDIEIMMNNFQPFPLSRDVTRASFNFLMGLTNNDSRVAEKFLRGRLDAYHCLQYNNRHDPPPTALANDEPICYDVFGRELLEE